MSDCVKGFVRDGTTPAFLHGTGFEGNDLLLHVLPIALRQNLVAALQMDLRDLQIHFRMAHGFVFDFPQSAGFVLRLRAQAVMFAGGGALAVKKRPLG